MIIAGVDEVGRGCLAGPVTAAAVILKNPISGLRDSKEISVGVTWITGFGPMSFSFSQPFNDGPFDRTEEFQFTIGQVF